jgi:hypothetical protein
MVRLQTLDLRIGVQVPASQPMNFMNIIRLGLLLAACSLMWGQDPADLFEKAPPPIDEALRARINQFYGAYMAGKFRDAYPLVAEDSQDAFMESSKDTFKDCKTLKIRYSENFTRASVLESCKGEWRWHGQTIPTQIPLSTNWKLVDGQWFWTYVKPTYAPNPFSPTGFVRIPDEKEIADGGPRPALPQVPTDGAAFARLILAKVKIDKTTITLRSSESSHEEVHVRNEMPGTISLSVDLLPQPGLKITPAKTQLNANEETVVSFDYRVDDALIACGECAKRVNGTATANLRIQPTNQVFPITIVFVREEPEKAKAQKEH